MELNKQSADWMLERIESGESQADLARVLGVSPGTVCRAIGAWIDATPGEAQRFARARNASAEAWLDRGMQALVDAMDRRGNTDATAARAYAQECARRAAIRNPAYRDKQDVTLANPPGEAFRSVKLTPEEAAIQYKELMGK